MRGDRCVTRCLVHPKEEGATDLRERRSESPKSPAVRTSDTKEIEHPQRMAGLEKLQRGARRRDEGPLWAVFSRVQMAEMPRFALT